VFAADHGLHREPLRPSLLALFLPEYIVDWRHYTQARNAKGEPMLVLTRHDGERIFVGDGIVITVIAAQHGKARIGVNAPPDMTIDREEIRRRKLDEERFACPRRTSGRGVGPGSANPASFRSG
jgi:carbon storage regulator